MIDVPRTTTLKFNEDGQYGANPAWGKQGVHIIFRCKCGILYNLTENGWNIANDGTVTPSIHHDDSHCGFHEFVKLENYPPPPPTLE